MNKRPEYIFGAMLLATGLYCVGASIIKLDDYLETKRITKVRTVIKDQNGNPIITQVSSYSHLDTDKDGKYDTFDIVKETLDDKGKVIAAKKETLKLEQLTDQELAILKLKR